MSESDASSSPTVPLEAPPPVRSASEIQVFSFPYGVRKRPGMYIGAVGSLGLLHLAFALLDRQIRQHRRGKVTCVDVHIRAGIVVTDDGPGFGPAQFAAFAAEVWAPDDPDVHDSGFSIPMGVVSALSAALVVLSDDGVRRQQVFVRGEAVGPVVELGPGTGRGTTIHLVPDVAVLGEARFPVAALRKRLRELAMLYPGLAIRLDGALVANQGGIVGRARRLAGDVRETLVVTPVPGADPSVAVAVAWGDGRARVEGFVNGLMASGTHLSGLLEGLEGTPTEGRVVVADIWTARAVYDGRTRRELRGDELREGVRDAVRAAVEARAP